MEDAFNQNSQQSQLPWRWHLSCNLSKEETALHRYVGKQREPQVQSPRHGKELDQVLKDRDKDRVTAA